MIELKKEKDNIDTGDIVRYKINGDEEGYGEVGYTRTTGTQRNLYSLIFLNIPSTQKDGKWISIEYVDKLSELEEEMVRRMWQQRA